MTGERDNEIVTRKILREELQVFATKDDLLIVNNDLLTTKNELKNEIVELKTYIREGFEMVFSEFERVHQKMDELMMVKTPKEDVYALEKRILRIENKIA